MAQHTVNLISFIKKELGSLKSWYFQDQELFDIVDKAWNDAWDIIHSEEGWKEEKKNDENGDIVFSRKNSDGR